MCSSVNPILQRLVCDRPAGHKGDHSGQAVLFPGKNGFVSRHWWLRKEYRVCNNPGRS